MNEVVEEQQIDILKDNDEKSLGGILFEPNEQIIEKLGEAIIKYIIEDGRLNALKKRHVVTENRGHRNPCNGMGNLLNRSYIGLIELIPKSNNELKKSLKKHKWAKEYIQIVETLYQELFAEDLQFPFGNESDYETLDLRNSNMKYDQELLMRLEIFMLALIYQPTPAFTFLGSSGRRVRSESIEQLKNRVTRIGFELLYIISEKNEIQKFKSENLTRNVKILIDFLGQLDENIGKKTMFNISHDLTFESLTDLNNLLLKLKAFVEKGRLKKNVSLSQMYRQRDGSPQLEQVIVRPNQIEINKDWVKRSNQLTDAIQYFQKFKNQNILLYRTQIYLQLDSGRVTAKQFKDFFGMVNKKAKRPNGMLGYLDFLYFWREDFITNELKLDLITIYDTNTLLEISDEPEPKCKQRNLQNELKDFWQANTDASMFEGKNVKLKFNPIDILQAPKYGLSPEFLIEAGDNKNWAIFEQKILPYFIFLEFLDVNYTDAIKNRFKRGQSNK